MPELPVTAPLASLIPAVIFQHLDELFDLHLASDLDCTDRITLDLTGVGFARVRVEAIVERSRSAAEKPIHAV